MAKKHLNILLTLLGLVLVIVMLYILDKHRRVDLSKVPVDEHRAVQPNSNLKN
jgi:hypothetical protein